MLTKAIAFLFAIFLLLPFVAEAKVYIDLAAPQAKRLPIAIQDFKPLGDESRAKDPAVARLGAEIADTLRSDIRFLGPLQYNRKGRLPRRRRLIRPDRR